MSHRSSPPVAQKTPLALLEYHPHSFDSDNHGILIAQQNKGMPLKKLKSDGFQLDLEHETPVTGSHSRNIVDAGLLMGRSFRVGWGPNGILVHSGTAVGSSCSRCVISSVINVEKVAIDKVVRDVNNKVTRELVNFSFDAPLNLHRELNHETEEVGVGSFKLKLQKVVSNCIMLPEICWSYLDILESQLDVPGISASARLVLMHQVMVWELIKVLYIYIYIFGRDSEEDMIHNTKEGPPEVDLEALPLISKSIVQLLAARKCLSQYISVTYESWIPKLMLTRAVTDYIPVTFLCFDQIAFALYILATNFALEMPCIVWCPHSASNWIGFEYKKSADLP